MVAAETSFRLPQALATSLPSASITATSWWSQAQSTPQKILLRRSPLFHIVPPPRQTSAGSRPGGTAQRPNSRALPSRQARRRVSRFAVPAAGTGPGLSWDSRLAAIEGVARADGVEQRTAFARVIADTAGQDRVPPDPDHPAPKRADLHKGSTARAWAGCRFDAGAYGPCVDLLQPPKPR